MYNILLVDDDPSFLDSALLGIFHLGNVFTSRDCENIGQLLAERPYDVIVTDLKMDHSNGIAIMEFVQRLPAPIPVILVTAYATKDVALNAISQRVFSILEKPVDIYKLRSEISKACEKHQIYKNKETLIPTTQNTLRSQIILKSRTFIVCFNNEEIQLTETEFRIISSLYGSWGKLFERDALIEQIWGTQIIADNVFDTHLGNLKRKLPFLKPHLQVIRGKGYILGN